MIEFRAREILAKQRSRLENLDSFRGLELWRDALLQRNSLRRGSWGCELGSLAAELSDTDENARVALAEHFRDWERLLGAWVSNTPGGVLVRAAGIRDP